MLEFDGNCIDLLDGIYHSWTEAEQNGVLVSNSMEITRRPTSARNRGKRIQWEKLAFLQLCYKMI